MNYLIKLCDKFGLLQSDLDYHLVRGSMVLMFLFFGYQKWFEYEAQALIPYISNGPLISWMYPVFGIRGACLFLGGFGMDLWSIDICGILEQDRRSPWRARRNRFVHFDHYDHSIHARRMGGIGRRLSRND